MRPQSGQCEGAITTDVHIRFALGPLDPGCNFADVTPVGSNLNTGFYAIAFSRADGATSQDYESVRSGRSRSIGELKEGFRLQVWMPWFRR